jgi:hypothetical protein
MTRLLEIVAEVDRLITSAGRRENAAGGDKELCSCPPFVSQLMRNVHALLPPQSAISERSNSYPRPSAFQGMGIFVEQMLVWLAKSQRRDSEDLYEGLAAASEQSLM